MVDTAYQVLYTFSLAVIGVLILLCLFRAIKGPKVADRVIAGNMMGTLVTIMVCVLAFVKNEGYLVDIAIIYTMLSFLAVVLLCKMLIGVARAKNGKKEAQGHD